MKNLLPVGVVLFLILAVTAIVIMVSQGGEQKDISPDQPQVVKKGASLESESKKGAEERELIKPVSITDPEDESLQTDIPEFAPLDKPGWNIWGIVSDNEENTVKNAKVVLGYDLDYSGIETEVSTNTDKSGIYNITVLLPDLFSSVFKPVDPFPGNFSGYVQAAGYLRNYIYSVEDLARLPNPFERSDPIRIDFILDKGMVMRGRVLNAFGAPVHEAEVFIRAENEKDFSDQEYEFTDRTGLFMNPIKKPGPHYLLAVKDKVGVAHAGPFNLNTDSDYCVPDIYLEGAGEIAGTIEYPNGNPARDIGLFAYSERFIGKVKGGYNPGMMLGMIKENQCGLSFSRVYSKVDGQFHFRGLEEGKFFVGWNQAKMKKATNPVLYMTGTMDVRLIIDIYRLKLTAHDSEGFAIPKAFAIVKCGGSSKAGSMEAGDFGWTSIEPGPVSVLVGVGERNISKNIEVPEGQYETEVDILFGEPLETGSIKLTVSGLDGESVNRIQAMFYNRETGLFQTSLRKKSTKGEYRFDLPPGSFNLTLKDWAIPGVDNDYLSTDVIPVEIRSSKETVVKASMIRGGNLSLIVRCPLPEENSKHPKIIARLIRPEQRISFCTIMKNKGYSISNFLKSNRPQTTWKPLMPGRYTLEITAEGFEPAEVLFSITPGAFVEREVQLIEKK